MDPRPPQGSSDSSSHGAGVRVALVVAMADNGVIGRAGALPWHLPDDLKRFKALTLDKPVLMGRRTYESIGRALPGRRNLVLSRGAAPQGQGRALREQGAASQDSVEYVASLHEACERVQGAEELCVIGGARVYELALPIATVIHLTLVHGAVEGDVRFPEPEGRSGPEGEGGRAAGTYAWRGWREAERTEHPPDARHAHAMSFVRLERERGDIS